MDDLYTRSILGHLVADYLFQPKEMAVKKGNPDKDGLYWCLAHCIVYTFFVCLFMWKFNIKTILLVFLSHYPIDRFSLGSKWLDIIKGRSLIEEYKTENVDEKMRSIQLSFASIVYVIVDNTLHFLLLWLITNLNTRRNKCVEQKWILNVLNYAKL